MTNPDEIHHDPEARARAIGVLLANPLLRRARDEETFRNVAVQRTFLARWFEDNLGWTLHVDVRAGVARLHKRTQRPDPRRGVRRQRSGRRPFDAFRYQLLALACAEMLRRQHTTLGDLADAVARICAADDRLRQFDVTRHTDRVAFVDALLWLRDVGAIDVTAGEIGGFEGSSESNAVLRADTTVIPLLLSSDVPASRIDLDEPAPWIERLTAEPRYGTTPIEPERADRELRTRWTRHQLIRGLLDDPAVDLDDLHPTVREYLFTPAGRDKALKAVDEAGMRAERHADVWLCIDTSRASTTTGFASAGRASTVQQAAAMLLAALVDTNEQGGRRPVTRRVVALEHVLRTYLDRNPAWARTARSGRGEEALCAEAVDLLEEFGLARRQGDEVVPRPAAARFVIDIRAVSDESAGAPS